MAMYFILLEEIQRRKNHRRQVRDVSNPFEVPDAEFIADYRISKDMGLFLCQELGELLEPTRSDGVPVHYKILLSIKLLADGGYQRPSGKDHNLCVAQTTVSKFFMQVLTAINQRLKPQWIKFPDTEASRAAVAQGFCNKFGLPAILGVIDCTHIKLFPPPRPHGLQYINRKGQHTINVQLIADVNCVITNVNAQYPGKVHDQFIFNNSVIKNEMRRLHHSRIGDYYLLGDSGYALEPWMMTPILDAIEGSPEDRFTEWHCRTRNTIERTNGYLKGSLRCLGIDRRLHYDPTKTVKIIYACCTIYNIMKYFRVPMTEEETQDDNDDADENEDLDLGLYQQALNKRQRIVNRYF